MQFFENNKKIVLIVGSVVVVLVGATALLSFWNSSDEYGKDRAGDVTSYSDIDGDGLADWEEILWRTNPEDPDTDNDGTSDGEEVLANRNPWVPGPDDSLIDYPAFNSYEETISASTSTTERVALRLAANYLELKDRNIPITPEFKKTLFNSSLDEAQESLPKLTSYTRDDIIVANKDLRTYGEQVAYIIVSNSPRNAKNEYVTVLRALYEEDYSELDSLIEIANGYEAIRDNLLKLSAPYEARDTHVRLINSMHALQHTIRLMALIEDDPIAGSVGLDKYPEAANHLTASFEKLDHLFSTNNITYNSSENASMFSI